MTITFLGTGSSQGVPVIACPCSICSSSDPRDQRLRSAICLTKHGKSILIDAGPDLRQQLLRARIGRVDALMLTHEHRDHTSGLGEMRILVLNNKRAIPIHAGTRVLTCLRREFTYLFEKTLCQGIPNFELYPIENFPFDVEFLSVLPIQVYHGALPIWGFRMGKLTYITDAKVISEEEMTKIKGTTVLIVNALQREFHPAHFSLEEAVALSQRVNAKATYLTHISHHLGLHREISKKLPHDIHVAYDGLKISL